MDVPGFRYWKDDRIGFGMLWSEDENAVRAVVQENGTPSSNGAIKHTIRKKKVKPAPAVNFTQHLDQHRANAREVYLLADILGVRPEALTQLQMGYVPEAEDEPEHWLFPERDAEGTIIGLLRRYANGKKKRLAGAQSGLIFDPAAPIADVLLVVEGPTDVAAALTMGLCAVGRPNNLSGGELLAPLIRQKTEARDVLVVVLGENDEKEDGLWPGKEGATRVAGQLSRLLGRRIAWAMPPDGIKDLREWLARDNPNLSKRTECRKVGQDVLDFVRTKVQWIDPPEGEKPTAEKSQTTCHVPDSLITNKGGMGGEKGAEHHIENLGHRPCPSKTQVYTDFSQWDSLKPAVQDILVRGRSARLCPRHYVPLLQGRANRHIGLALRVDCRAWSCPTCSLRRRCRWMLHLMGIFELQTSLYAQHITAQQIAALRKCVHRQDGDYLAISQSDGRILFVASCAFPSSRLATPLDAADLVALALQCLDTAKRKPVSTSRGWALHENRSEADYVRRGAAPKGKFALVVNRLRRAKLAPSVQPTDRGARADWLFPASWHAEQIEWYYEGLASPPSVGEMNETKGDEGDA
jgi:hypothetical protein